MQLPLKCLEINHFFVLFCFAVGTVAVDRVAVGTVAVGMAETSQLLSWQCYTYSVEHLQCKGLWFTMNFHNYVVA